MSQMEIERKFLLKDDSYKADAAKQLRMVQGYICRETGKTVRIRISGDRAWLTIKGKSSEDGTSRYEWEKEIDAADAENLMKLCSGSVIDKTRYIVPYDGHVFEVDEFYGANEGLTVAEIELSDKDEKFGRPDWLGAEVTGDRKYYNSMLASHPFSEWETE